MTCSELEKKLREKFDCDDVTVGFIDKFKNYISAKIILKREKINATVEIEFIKYLNEAISIRSINGELLIRCVDLEAMDIILNEYIIGHNERNKDLYL